MYEVPQHLGRTGDNNFSAMDKPVLEKYCFKKLTLDIGCSNGDVVKYLRDNGTAAYGVDGDVNAVRKFSDESVRPYLICHDYTQGKSHLRHEVDVAISTDFVEHVAEKYIDNYMKDFLLANTVILHTPPEGTPGHHHVNTQNADYWILLFAQYGMELHDEMTTEARKISGYHNPRDMAYFHKHPDILPKNNYLVFVKK